MFTGIVEEVGTMQRIQSGEIYLRAEAVLEGTKIGDSIAVNGVCLTVTRLHPNGFAADVMPETLRRSNLGQLKPGDPVDLERAMAADGRFGGHMMSGHIDGTGTITELRSEGNAVWVRIRTTPEILNLIVEKGSIAIDGISLTVATVSDTDFQVSIIPHTGSETILLRKKAGNTVNLENDIIGKYVQKLLRPGNGETVSGKDSGTDSIPGGNASSLKDLGNGASNTGGITWEFLAENGF